MFQFLWDQILYTKRIYPKLQLVVSFRYSLKEKSSKS